MQKKETLVFNTYMTHKMLCLKTTKYSVAPTLCMYMYIHFILEVYILYSIYTCTTLRQQTTCIVQFCVNYSAQHASFVQTIIVQNRSIWPIVLCCSSNEILGKWCNVVVYLKHVAGRWDDGVVVDGSVWHHVKYEVSKHVCCDIYVLLHSTYQSQITGSGERLTGWE